MRYLYKAVDDYRYSLSGDRDTDWKLLVESALHRIAAHDLPAAPLNRAATKEVEYDLVRKLHGRGLSTPELKKEWNDRTGKSLDSYYRRRKELGLH